MNAKRKVIRKPETAGRVTLALVLSSLKQLHQLVNDALSNVARFHEMNSRALDVIKASLLQAENDKDAHKSRTIRELEEQVSNLRGEVVEQKQENDRLIGYIQRIRDVEEAHTPRPVHPENLASDFESVSGLRMHRRPAWWR